MNSDKKALIVGCGYVGERVGRRLVDRGYTVWATSRRSERLAELAACGFHAVELELSAVGRSELFDTSYDLVIYAVAPGRGGDAELAFRDGVGACLKRLAGAPPGRFVYLSSTGVYAQDDGSEIDEETPAEACSGRQGLLLAGERGVIDASTIVPGVVLRLGGLYGPNRSPVDWCSDLAWRERLAKGSREAYMNWVHADDAAEAVCLAGERGTSGEVYLVVDGTPVKRGDFYDYACEVAGQSRLELKSDPKSLAKRCSNRKAREQLGFAPKYPSFREGLASLG